jgi:HPt (histidine-containing phosphotransfer) domain-containing protein
MPVNISMLHGYLDNNTEMVKRFLRLFCNAIPADLVELRKNMETGDFSMGSVLAHSIKTQCSYLGLEQEVALALEIEHSQEQRKNPMNLLDELEFRLQKEILEIKMTHDLG